MIKYISTGSSIDRIISDVVWIISTGFLYYFDNWYFYFFLIAEKNLNLFKLFTWGRGESRRQQRVWEPIFPLTVYGPYSRLLKSLHTEKILKQNDKSQGQTAKWNVDMFSQNLSSASGFVSANRPFGKIL